MIFHSGGPKSVGAFTSALIKPLSPAAAVVAFACQEENSAPAPWRTFILITRAAGESFFDGALIVQIRVLNYQGNEDVSRGGSYHSEIIPHPDQRLAVSTRCCPLLVMSGQPCLLEDLLHFRGDSNSELSLRFGGEM